MIWKQKTSDSIATVVQTGFLVSVMSYVGFWGIDLLAPGFVSNYVSVHIFLLTALVFGVGWGTLIESYRERIGVQAFVALILGLFLSVLVWYFSEGLEAYRGLLVLVALPSPLLLLKLLRV